MSKPINFFHSFQTKVTVALIACMLFTLALSDFFIYKFTFESKFNSVRNRLMVIAQTATLLVDSDLLQEIPLNHNGVDSPAYKAIVEKLKKVKEINPQIIYIYTMTQTDQEGIWKFIVDPDNVVTKGRKKLTSLPGDVYDASRFLQMMKAFDQPSADKKLQIDEWGKTLSGYAPIRNKEGKAIAMLGVDMAADDIYQIEKQILQRSGVIFVLGVILAIIMGIFISKQITGSIKSLVEGTRRIGNGDLQYKVQVKTKDEIGELAESFNQMAGNLDESRQRLLEYFYNVVQTLVKVLEVRDQYTKGHSESVAIYAGKIAKKMGHSHETIKMFKRMTLLHDIGKLGIKDTILHKPGSLTPEEWEEIKKHPLIGESILKPVLEDQEMLAVVREHHERYDGTGYPGQKKSEEINMFAAIVSVADAYDAMTSDRSYRKALSPREAIEELKKHRGSQFHPKVVDTFLEILIEEKKLS